MTWLAHHRKSEEFASRAEIAFRRGRADDASGMYAQAAVAEEQALDAFGRSDPFTFGILAVSVVALHYKAGNLEQAEQLSYRLLTDDALPMQASEQIREILSATWTATVRRSQGIESTSNRIEFALRGAEILYGAAPADLVLAVVKRTESLIIRVTELLAEVPHRTQGSAERHLVEACRPWMYQAAPGSYRFEMAVEGPMQLDLFATTMPDPDTVTRQSLAILQASATAPNTRLAEVVPNIDYRLTFLKLVRDLSPNGHRYRRLEIQSPMIEPIIALTPDTRSALTETIRECRQLERKNHALEACEVRGVLRAVHLDRDWIEIADDERSCRIVDVGDVVDDVIGPMINRQVIVSADKDNQGKLHFRDIEEID